MGPELHRDQCPRCHGEVFIDNPEHVALTKRGLPRQDVEKIECPRCEGVGMISLDYVEPPWKDPGT